MVTPQLRRVTGIDELGIDHESLVRTANLALQKIADVELAADGARIDNPAVTARLREPTGIRWSSPTAMAAFPLDARTTACGR